MGAAIEGFFWPKIFWDFLTKTLDPAVKPFPVLQIINLLLGAFMFLLDWPAPGLGGSMLHRSLEFRLAILPLAGLAAALLYQATNAAIYYVVALVVYFWAYSEGEVRPPSIRLYKSDFTDHSPDHLRETVDTSSAWPQRIIARIGCASITEPAHFFVLLIPRPSRETVPSTSQSFFPQPKKGLTERRTGHGI
jgi:hypothetical protein